MAGVMGWNGLVSAGAEKSAEAPKPAPAAANLAKPAADPKSWQFEEFEEAVGVMKPDGDAISFVTKKVDGTDWHVQAIQAGLELKEGKNYAITFKARSVPKRTIQAYAGVNEDDYHAIGLDDAIDLGPEWREITLTFKAEGVVPKNNRFGLLLGQETGTVWVKDLAIVAK